MPKKTIYDQYSGLICQPFVQWNAVLASSAIALLTGYGWYLNVKSSWVVIERTFSGQEPEARHPDNLLMEILSVDLSTVTTLLLTVTLLFLAFGFWRGRKWLVDRIRHRTNGSESTKTAIPLHEPSKPYPFVRGYKAYYTEMGLLGTLFAFIIAFKQASSAVISQQDNAAVLTGSSSDILLMALGTALWSSFAAVFLAIIVCPAITWLFRRAWILPMTHGLGVTSPPGDDLEQTTHAVALLTEKTKAAADALKYLAENSGEVTIRNALEQLSRVNGDLESMKSNLTNHHENLTERIKWQSEIMSERIDKNHGTILELEKKIEEFEVSANSFRQTKAELEALTKQFERFTGLIKGF